MTSAITAQGVGKRFRLYEQRPTTLKERLVRFRLRSREFWALPSKAIAKCVPGARQVVLQNVNHDGPMRDPAAFTAAIFEFLSRR